MSTYSDNIQWQYPKVGHLIFTMHGTRYTSDAKNEVLVEIDSGLVPNSSGIHVGPEPVSEINSIIGSGVGVGFGIFMRIGIGI